MLRRWGTVSAAVLSVMNSEAFKRVEQIFEAALNVEPHQRAAFVREQCGDDTSLIERVLRLLAYEARELVCDDLEALASSVPEESDDLVGTQVGRYVLRGRIGAGGFGVVYRAEQVDPVRRTVAVKVIKRGMDTEQVIARFEAERQALAVMDHACIARVFDAGVTETGRSYFVMELVDGMPITRFCDEHHLDLRQRLELFIRVCQAVQHAHQKGVIHRDLKPPNVLVSIEDGRPTPKIIDFGIAKATQGRLIDRTLTTDGRRFIGTPEYMSPEQASVDSQHLDTRTDIYSLGVLLYEILVGVTPFRRAEHADDGENPEEILRLVREDDPRRPSLRLSTQGEKAGEIARRRNTEPAMLRRALEGDLDWIVLKALEKSPDRRYESAAELAHEIERHLNDEPIIARPPGPLYLATKFVRRNQVAVTTIAVITATLLIGLVVSVIALSETQKAHSQTEEALALAKQRLLDSLHAQARAARTSDQIGRRFQAMQAIAHAVQIKPSAKLREEAIAVMALPDFEPLQTLGPHDRVSARGLRVIDRFAHVTGPGELIVQFKHDEGDRIRLTAAPKRVWHIEFSDDGHYVAAKLHDHADDADVVVWEVSTGTVVFEKSGLVASDHFALCRKRSQPVLVVGGVNATLDVHALPGGELTDIFALHAPALWFAGDPATERLAVSHFDARQISIWSIRDAEQIALRDVPAAMRGLAWHPELPLLAGCGSDYHVYIWDVVSGDEYAVLKGHEGQPTEVFFAPDAPVVATHGWDAKTRLWNVYTSEPLFGPMLDTRIAGFGDVLLTTDPQRVRFWRYEPAIECLRVQARQPFGNDLHLSFSSCGSLLLSVGSNGIRLWDAQSARELAVLMPQRPVFARFLGDAVVTATEDVVQQWSLTRSGTSLEIGEPTTLFRAEGVRTGNYCDVTQWVALGTNDLTILDARHGNEVAVITSLPASARSPIIDPRGCWVFVNNWRGMAAQLWSLPDAELVREFPGTHVTGAFSPDGNSLLASTASAIQSYATATWTEQWRYERVRADDLAGLIAFSGDARLAAVTHSRFDIHVLDAQTGVSLAQLTAPQPVALAALAVNGDGTKVAALTSPGLLLIWDLQKIGQGLDALGLGWP